MPDQLESEGHSMDDNMKRLFAVQRALAQKEQNGKEHELAPTCDQVVALKQSLRLQSCSPTERREWIETEQLALRQAYNHHYDAGLHGKVPEEILQRREKLRLVALGEGLRALRAIQDAGGAGRPVRFRTEPFWVSGGIGY